MIDDGAEPVEMSEELTISDRRTRRLASGALRPALESGVPQIGTSIPAWSTEQMLEDMRGESPSR